MALPINQSTTSKPVSQPASKPGPPNPSGKSSNMPVGATSARLPKAVM